MKTCAKPFPHQLTTRGDATVSMANMVLPPLVSPAAFATGQIMKTNRANVPLCGLIHINIKLNMKNKETDFSAK